MEFNCRIERESFLLNVKDKSLQICNKTFQYTFDLSLKILITWLFRENELNGFIIEDLIVEGDNLNMKKLRSFLGGEITYTGIQIFYYFNGEINVSKNKATKVCSLINRQTKLKFSCKCFKKSVIGIEKIHKEIEIIKKASKHGLAPKIYECFQSNNCVYLIMENLERIQDQAYMEEDVMLVLYNLIQIISVLHQENIVHKNIKKSHIMFTEDNKIKLVGFGKAIDCLYLLSITIVIFKTTSLDWTYLKQELQCINSIMKYYFSNLYQKQNFFQADQLSLMPKEGNSLLESLLDWKSNSPYQLKELLCLPYFKLLKSEGISLQIQCMNPKFKTHIFQDDELESFL